VFVHLDWMTNCFCVGNIAVQNIINWNWQIHFGTRFLFKLGKLCWKISDFSCIPEFPNKILHHPNIPFSFWWELIISNYIN
jgi:hypothetical protein